MLFNSINYFVFLFIVFIINYLLPGRFRWIFLLSASIFFYAMAGAATLIVPVVITLSTFTFGLLIGRSSNARRRKIFLLSGLLINLGLLIFFKYINFFITTAFDGLNFFNHLVQGEQVVDHVSIVLQFVVPLGISYITFQAIGYLIEINRGNQNPEKNVGLFATYLMFFPKLLSGPIERAHNFIPQLRQKHAFDYNQVVEGLKRIAWGLFLKLVIANRLAIYTDAVFNNYEQQSGITLLIVSFLYTFQLFADFSGYTEMAIGSAQILGFRLMENFNNPFISKSTTELWRRWHISLSTWFSDYVFNPIVINKRDWNRWAVVYASFITFLLLGFWHGASWNYIVFGFLQALALSLEFLTKNWRKRIRKELPEYINASFGIIYVISFFSFSLIFFKADNIQSALYTIKHIFAGLPELVSNLQNHQFILGNLGDLGKKNLVLSVLLISFIGLVQYIQSKKSISEILVQKPLYIRWTAYYVFILSLLFLGVFENRQFIYFQF